MTSHTEPVRAKICGLTTADAIDSAVRGGAAFIGFIFYPPSPRNVSPRLAGELAHHLSDDVKSVAVTVDPSNEQLQDIFTEFRPDYLQLHGNETPTRVEEIKKIFQIPIIKALKIRNGDDIALAKNYTVIADMLLFDAKVDDMLPGGNGISFDWMLLKSKEFPLPWFLSGGLNSHNVHGAIATTSAKLVDVSSSVERSPGLKDPTLIDEFMKAIARI